MFKKLIPNLGNRANYVVHYKNLQFYFKQSDWMKKYIDFNIYEKE